MGRIGRSFALTAQAYRVLMQDKELMLLPLISGAIIVTVAVSFFFVSGITGAAAGLRQRDPATMILMFLFYVVTYGIGLFFQAAVIAGATERLRGGDPTVASALAAASRRLGPIVMWAVVAATVGMVLRTIQERVGFVGKIVVAIVGAAWSLATFFVVPVLVLEDRSIGDSFKRSLSVFKETWGESMVGGATLGMAAFCAWVTLVAVVGLLAWAGAGIVVCMAVFFPGALFLMVFFSAMQGIYVASLFRYATEGHATSGFDADVLSQAFVPKK
jgi:hypothetical protein